VSGIGAVDAAAQRHSIVDDAQGVFTGTLLAALGLSLFGAAGLLTGGSAGIAFLLHYATGRPFGALFFVINLPFYALAWLRMGPRFTLKTLAAVSLLSLLVEQLPSWWRVGAVEPWFAALAGGLLLGVGFVILFRHGASLGGLNVLVLWLQERLGWRAGVTQLAIDATILLASAAWLDRSRLAWSVVAALAMNLALAINHKPGRYAAF
jgi:uncharacterized membrane-anchored protein YitT (DUF2179 family)